jgi:K(+)-stimulated pyrophosphate-energized sodium pump
LFTCASYRYIPGREGVVCDHVQCVQLCAKASLAEMVLPGAIAVLTPISVGLLVGAKCLGGLLAGSIASGFMLAVMLSNTGGACDSAAKYVENEKAFGGKEAPAHQACVVGNTVGNPFKDTSGPALNILIKLMALISLVLAPIFRDDFVTWWQGLLVLILEVALCAAAYYYVWVLDAGEENPFAAYPKGSDGKTAEKV